MAALPQRADTEPGEPLAHRPVTVFRIRRGAMPSHWYRNRPLIRLSCPGRLELPSRPFDLPHIHVVAPIPGLDDLIDDDDLDDDEVVVYDALDDDDLGADDLGDDDLVEDEPVAHEPIAAPKTVQPKTVQPKTVQSKAVQSKAMRPRPAPSPRLRTMPAPAPRRSRTPLLVTAVIVAVVLALGVTGVLLRRNLSSGGPTATNTTAPAPATELAEAATWLRANLPTATIGADATTREELTRRGFPGIQLTDLDQPNSRVRYAVVTPTVRAAGVAAGSPLATLLSEALPVAVFGNGQARVEISQLGAMSTSLTTAQQARMMAGQGLARNPGLHIVTSLASTISDGRLDMRAATLLAVLAGQRSTALLKLPQAGAEARAGAPIRIIVLQLAGDPTSADQLLGSTVRALSPSLTPYQTARQPDGSYQIVWLPDLNLTPPAN